MQISVFTDAVTKCVNEGGETFCTKRRGLMINTFHKFDLALSIYGS